MALAPEFDRNFKKELCEILGVDPRDVTDIVITAKHDDAVRVSISRIGNRLEFTSLFHLLKRKAQDVADAPAVVEAR